MYAEADLLPISALQHLIYCPRQCALIHNEQLWAENRLTVEGRQLHDKAHDDRQREHRPGRGGAGVRITRGLHLCSFALGLRGIADVVEFPDPKPGDEQRESPGQSPESASNPRTPPPLPIEYKRGRPKPHDADKVQLCAQALCLEEMLKLPPGSIPAGELFYGKTRRRQPVRFDIALRAKTTDTAGRLHDLVRAGRTPPAAYDPRKCDRCSLLTLCMPAALRVRRTTADRFRRLLNDTIGGP